MRRDFRLDKGNDLRWQRCVECGGLILVNEREHDRRATGMVALQWVEDYRQTFVGYICNQHAWLAAMRTNKKFRLKGGIAGGGGLPLEFCYD